MTKYPAFQNSLSTSEEHAGIAKSLLATKERILKSAWFVDQGHTISGIFVFRFILIYYIYSAISRSITTGGSITVASSSSVAMMIMMMMMMRRRRRRRKQIYCYDHYRH